MFSSSLISLVYALFLAIVGGIVGIAERLALSFAFKTPKRIYWKDALLGASGMVGGFLVCALTPWPENTVRYRVGETVVTSTMNRFQHPYYVAFALALCLPLIRFTLQRRDTRSG